MKNYAEFHESENDFIADTRSWTQCWKWSPHKAFYDFIKKKPKTSQLMLYREIIAVCSQIHTKHTACVQNVKFLYVKPVGT